MLKHVITAVIAGSVAWGAVYVTNGGIAWWQKYQAQQDWYAAHGGKHEDHK